MMSSANTATGFIPSTGFSSQCFPVRSLTRYNRNHEDGEVFFSHFRSLYKLLCVLGSIHINFSFFQGGAWLVAYRAEQRRRFKAVLCAGVPSIPTKSLIKEFKSDDADTIEEDSKPPKLDGFYLVRLTFCSLRVNTIEIQPLY